jgi:hypothetical protein
LVYFALSIPADGKLERIELFHRPFVVRHASDATEGNAAFAAHGLSAATFMDGATLVMERELD